MAQPREGTELSLTTVVHLAELEEDVVVVDPRRPTFPFLPRFLEARVMKKDDLDVAEQPQRDVALPLRDKLVTVRGVHDVQGLERKGHVAA